MEKVQRMYGLWPSPITSKMLAGGTRLSEPCWDTDGRTLAWVEGRSDRGVIVVQQDGGAPRDLTPNPVSVRAFVGYGGGDFTLAHGVAYFVEQQSQRIYRQELAGGAPRPITPGFGASSSPAVSPDGRWLIYVHSYEDIDAIAIVDTEGKHWPRRLAEGRDFYMQPAWSPDGSRVAWVEWDHPLMPWDGCELRLTRLTLPGEGMPRAASSAIVAGGADTAVFQPAFSADASTLYYLADPTGLGQLHAYDIESRTAARLTDAPGDLSAPAWGHAMRRFAVLPGGDVAVLANASAADSLMLVGAGGDTRYEARSQEGYTVLSHPVAGPDGRVAAVGTSGVTPPRVVLLDPAGGRAPHVVRRSDPELVPSAALSTPESLTWRSFDGEDAHGLYYPPASDRYESAGPAPLVVVVHGGPTSQYRAGWDATAQFFATRGYGVLVPNYRGSTGYGREYMLKLRGSWGIYDVEDAKSGAQALVDAGHADAGKLVIYGGSAGGYTVLKSLVDQPGFYRAGVSLFGVSNLFTLAADTHKFEARYLDSMIGPLPEAAAKYRDWSPGFHAERIKDPVALFQGDIDRVVPREQSDSIAATLRARGVPHEYHVFEGEGHGWRKAETIDRFWTLVERFLTQYVLYS
jgi:dipeptidyl aminopeptidase/acylaminoacyl peptidase